MTYRCMTHRCMTHRFQVVGAALLAAALAGGCASTSPQAEQHFGQSVRASMAAQVIHPGAAANTNPVHGIDAAAALGAQKLYQASFNEPSRHQPAMVSGRGK